MASLRRASIWLLAACLAAGPVLGQSMVEIAKKEKDRREAAKKGAAAIVTNADLSRTKKKPAMATVPLPAARLGEEAAEGNDQPPPTAVAAPSAVPAPATESEVVSEAAVSFEQKKAELTTAHERAKERAELLDLKMRALNQQLFTFNSMSTKDQIQKAIGETYLKLQEAQAEAVKAKADLEKLINQAASANLPPIWIKIP